MPKEPVQLTPLFRERPWGRENLAPYFPDARPGKPIGEVWFTLEEQSGACPLLVKFLFTSQRLSVQVHPDDEYAQRHHQCLGKTEAWYVIDSQEPGELAVGFRKKLTREQLFESARSGEIENLLDWRKVKPGDVVFTPAGTVHAIGAGLTICEIQQNSDITYRLYDYGRPRELHLEHGVKVSHLGPHEHNVTPKALAGWRDELITSQYFRIERLRPRAGVRIAANLPDYLLLICLKGTGAIAGRPYRAGQAWMIPAGVAGVEITGANSEWILTYTAEQPLSAEKLEAAAQS